MKYEFHVGDYVETKTGTIGFVSNVSIDNLPRWTVTKVSDTDAVQSIYRVGFDYTIVVALSLINEFNRIGQYDFTKKDEGKIEPLKKSWVLTDDVDGKGEYYFDSREIIKKINELVEAVNELKTDYEKHLQAHELTER